MADAGNKARSLEETPTWAVAAVCFVLVLVSIFIEHAIQGLGKWFKKKKKLALDEALEKVKAELMLMGFLSLLLTVLQGPISDLCISPSLADTWHPCDKNSTQKYQSKEIDKCKTKGKVAFVSAYGIHQLHIFIFVLAVFHILNCIITYALGNSKMKTWKAWENETKRTDPEKFRFSRDTSFVRRHLNFWTRSGSAVSVWIVCFFRQFYGSVTKVDYLTLRHGFITVCFFRLHSGSITAHMGPAFEAEFDFHKYIKKSLDDDFKVVVGISPIIWFIAVLFLLAYTHGWRSYFWLPFIPLVIILMVGTKLQVIITQMGLRIQERADVVLGAPVVELGDDLFWFGKPRFLLRLIHVALFTNAFQLAFFVWSTYEFTIKSCYHENTVDIIIRISMGVIIQVLCSYVTLPLYALVNLMGTHVRETIFNESAAGASMNQHQTEKKQSKQSKHSENTNYPFSSRPETPTHGMSPVHLLHSYPQASDQYDPTSSFIASSDHHDIDVSAVDHDRSQLEMKEVAGHDGSRI